MYKNPILEQSKKEAKRLLKLAKSNSHNLIEVASLTKAKDILAILNGFPNWNAYEHKFHTMEQPFNYTESNIESSHKIELDSSIGLMPRPSHQTPLILGTYQKKHGPFNIFLKESQVEIDDYTKGLNISIAGQNGYGRESMVDGIVVNQIKNNSPVLYLGHFDGVLDFYYQQYTLHKMPDDIDRFRVVNFNKPKFSHSIYPFECYSAEDFLELFEAFYDGQKNSDVEQYRALVYIIFKYLIYKNRGFILPYSIIKDAFTINGIRNVLSYYSNNEASYNESIDYFKKISSIQKTSSEINFDNSLITLIQLSNSVFEFFDAGYSSGLFSDIPTASISMYIQKKSHLFLCLDPMQMSRLDYKIIGVMLSIQIRAALKDKIYKPNLNGDSTRSLLVFHNFSKDIVPEIEKLAVYASQFRGYGFGFVYSNNFCMPAAVSANTYNKIWFKTEDAEVRNAFRSLCFNVDNKTLSLELLYSGEFYIDVDSYMCKALAFPVDRKNIKPFDISSKNSKPFYTLNK